MTFQKDLVIAKLMFEAARALDKKNIEQPEFHVSKTIPQFDRKSVLQKFELRAEISAFVDCNNCNRTEAL